jgi:PAS domain S-box-containing protein
MLRRIKPSSAAKLVCESPEPTFVVSMTGDVMGWNAPVAQLLGIPEAKALGQKCWTLLAGRSPEGSSVCSATCPILEAARGGMSSAPVEIVSVPRRRGAAAAVAPAPRLILHHLALRDPDGRPDAVVHLVEDAAERRRRERVGERLRAVATGIGALDVALTRREREVLSLLVEGLTTREAAERLGVRPNTARNYVQRVLAKMGAPNRLAAVMKLLSANAPIANADVVGRSGGPVAVRAGTSSGRVAATDAYLPALFSAAVEHADVALSICDLSGRILYVNEANARLVGRPARELIGQPVNVLLPTALREQSGALLAALRQEGSIHAELPNLRGDGTTVFVGLSAEVARDAQGNPICIVATVRDLSADLQRIETLSSSALAVASPTAGEVLPAILRLARTLTGARYAAFGVVRDTHLERFIPDGLTDEEMARIGHWPEGRGLLGEMIKERRTIRAADIRAHPRSIGFPAGHPAMTSFLGVPVQVDGRVYGHLYLTDKIGAAEFGFVDERLADLFAAHAAVAIRDGERMAELESTLADLHRERAARGRLATAFEESSDEIYVFDAASLRFLETNSAARRNLGYTMEELAALTPLDLKPEFTPDSFAVLIEPLGAGRRHQLVFETVHRRKDGSLYPVEVRLQLSAAESPPVFIAVVVDTTERRRVEAERARLAAAVEQSADSIMVTDLGGAIVYVNPAFERLSGYARSEVTGQNPRFLKSGRHDPAFYRAMWTALERGEAWSGSLVNRRRDGSLYESEAVISPVRDAAGRISHFVEVARDVTHERSLEAQLRQAQKMEAVGQLAGGVAHDFNNLLTAIVGYSDFLLAEMKPGDRRRAEVGEIRRAADRAGALTQQLLAFSRRQVLQPQVLDLNGVIDGVVPMLRRLIGEHIDLATVLEPVLGRVRADPAQLEQVIVNLAVNARDAMPAGGTVTIETSNADLDAKYARPHGAAVRPGSYVLVAVTDTGIGMDAETQAHLFEPFFTTKELGTGSGLGLATVYGIVKQSDGYIWVYSEPGHGSSFKVYLPRVDAEAEPIEPPRPSSAAAGGSETVLVVEDEPAVRRLVGQILGRRGYRVLSAPDGQTAVSIFSKDPAAVDLLVTDVVMPGIGGVDLAERLTAERPGLRVLYLSGYPETSATQRGLPAGAAFLGKPFAPADLARKVREVLDEEAEPGS